MARNINVDIDTSDFDLKLGRFDSGMARKFIQAIDKVASEILRLSQFEVPHDTGELQNSGHVKKGNEESIVGYNKVYAARLHEHPGYIFQKGRKGKYLEDPIKHNMQVLRSFVGKTLKGFTI